MAATASDAPSATCPSASTISIRCLLRYRDAPVGSCRRPFYCSRRARARAGELRDRRRAHAWGRADPALRDGAAVTSGIVGRPGCCGGCRVFAGAFLVRPWPTLVRRRRPGASRARLLESALVSLALLVEQAKLGAD